MFLSNPHLLSFYFLLITIMNPDALTPEQKKGKDKIVVRANVSMNVFIDANTPAEDLAEACFEAIEEKGNFVIKNHDFSLDK